MNAPFPLKMYYKSYIENVSGLHMLISGNDMGARKTAGKTLHYSYFHLLSPIFFLTFQTHTSDGLWHGSCSM